MVTDTRKASGVSGIRFLNQPTAIPVKVDENGSPSELKLRGRLLKVESVDDIWRIDDEWWREQSVNRMYFECVVDGGIRITMFQDIGTRQWYEQRM